MKISTGTIQAPVTGGSQIVETAAPAPVAAPAGATENTGGELQSAVLQPALGTVRDMPAIDEAKVAALRDALARGELPFDAGKLAGLVERFHRSGS